jgi:hypothetical protein
MAGQLLARLEEPAARDPAPFLEPKAETIVRAAKGEDGGSRTSWLQRAATLCGWQLVAPALGDPVQPGWHHAVDSGGDTVVALICPGLKRADGTPIVEARVKVEPGATERDTQRLSFPPPRPAEAPPDAVEALATAVAAAPDPAPAIPTQPAVATPLPEMPTQPFALLPPASSSTTLASLSDETAIPGEEVPAAALAAAHALRIVAEDPAANDEALALVEGALADRAPETPKSDG